MKIISFPAIALGLLTFASLASNPAHAYVATGHVAVRHGPYGYHGCRMVAATVCGDMADPCMSAIPSAIDLTSMVGAEARPSLQLYGGWRALLIQGERWPRTHEALLEQPVTKNTKDSRAPSRRTVLSASSVLLSALAGEASRPGLATEAKASTTDSPERPPEGFNILFVLVDQERFFRALAVSRPRAGVFGET